MFQGIEDSPIREKNQRIPPRRWWNILMNVVSQITTVLMHVRSVLVQISKTLSYKDLVQSPKHYPK